MFGQSCLFSTPMPLSLEEHAVCVGHSCLDIQVISWIPWLGLVRHLICLDKQVISLTYCLRFWHVNCCDSQVFLPVKSPVWGNQVISSVLSIVWLHINWVWQSGRQFCQQSLSQPVHWLWPVMSISVSHGFRGQTFRGSYKHTVFVKKGWVELLSRLLSRWPPPFCLRHSCQEVWSFFPFLVEIFQLSLVIRPIVFVSHAFGAWHLVNLLGTDIHLSHQSCCLLVRIGQFDKLPNYFYDIQWLFRQVICLVTLYLGRRYVLLDSLLMVFDMASSSFLALWLDMAVFWQTDCLFGLS